ncbi:MAG: reverse transcriptase domain-containing protein [Candidatus Paceibacterota bacterium]
MSKFVTELQDELDRKEINDDPSAFDLFGYSAMEELSKFLESEKVDFLAARKIVGKLLNDTIDSFYNTWKMIGGRKIVSPKGALKRIQRETLKELYNFYSKEGSEISGFGSNFVKLLEVHRFSDYQFSIDLASAFNQINSGKVRRALAPYTEKKESKKLNLTLSYLLTVDKTQIGSGNSKESLLKSFLKKCFKKRVIPQGAPTSPFLFELVCLDLDQKLGNLARMLNCEVTRHVDDIQFSSKNPISQDKRETILNVVSQDFVVNNKKSCYFERSMSRPFTMLGMTILPGGRIRIPRKKSDRYRAVLHQICEKIKDGVKPNKEAINQVNGIMGFINGLKEVKGIDFRNSLKERIEEFKELRQNY